MEGSIPRRGRVFQKRKVAKKRNQCLFRTILVALILSATSIFCYAITLLGAFCHDPHLCDHEGYFLRANLIANGPVDGQGQAAADFDYQRGLLNKGEPELTSGGVQHQQSPFPDFQKSPHSKVCWRNNMEPFDVQVQVEGEPKSGTTFTSMVVIRMCQLAKERYAGVHVDKINVNLDEQKFSQFNCQFQRLIGGQVKHKVNINAIGKHTLHKSRLRKAQHHGGMANTPEWACGKDLDWFDCWCNTEDRYVVVFRDPRDVIVSLAHMVNQARTQEQLVEFINEGRGRLKRLWNWVMFRYQYWKEPLFSRAMVYYDDLYAGDLRSYRAIADAAFLDFLSDEDLADVIERASFKVMKQADPKFVRKGGSSFQEELPVELVAKMNTEMERIFFAAPELLKLWKEHGNNA